MTGGAGSGVGVRRLGEPRPARVRVADPAADVPAGCPALVDGQRVQGIVETWLIEDRWWTDRPMRRRYWEVVTESGRALVVHRDLVDGRWWRLR